MSDDHSSIPTPCPTSTGRHWSRAAVRCACARSDPCPQWAALHAHAVRPGRRRDQGRAARRRHDPVRQPAASTAWPATSCSRTPASATSASTCRVPRRSRCCWVWPNNATCWSRTSARASWIAWAWATTSSPQRNPRIVYASISGYGQTGPWVHRRAYAPVVGAETGFTKAQGDARARTARYGRVYTNDPHSNADVYTGMECAAGILAALYQRERTGRGDRIDVSMAQTMLYINEHVHDHLWDGPVDPSWVRSFGPGDYPVLTAANGETVVISGHPAERGTFDRFAAAIGRPDLGTDPRFVDVAVAPGPPRRADRAAARVGGDDRRRRPTSRRSWPRTSWRPACCARVRELCDTEWAADRQVTVARVRPWRRHDPHPQRSVALRRQRRRASSGEPRYRGEDNRQVLGELLGLDDAATRPAGGRRRAVEPSAMTLSFPVQPMKAAMGSAATRDRGRQVGVRDQVGRLPHAAVRRRRRAAAYECRAAAAWMRPPRTPSSVASGGTSTPRRSCSTARSWCSTTSGRPSFEGLATARHPSGVPRLRRAVDRRSRRHLVAVRAAPRTAGQRGRAGQQLDGAVVPHRRWRRAAGRHGRAWARRASSPSGWAAPTSRASAHPTGARSRTVCRVEVVIGGRTGGGGNRSNSFGALLVGRYDDQRRAAVRRRRGHRLLAAHAGRAVEPLRRARHADVPVRSRAAARCTRATPAGCEPVLRAEIEIAEFTNEGYVRHASFLRLI